MIRLALSSLRYYWRGHLGVLLGVALAAAVLTGSLLVGDSIDGSLRKHALRRLGEIHYAVDAPNTFFAASLAERVGGRTAAATRLRGMAMTDDQQINQVQVIGCDSNFWTFAGARFELAENEVALNAKLAKALDVGVGDEVSLRVEKPSLLPREAPLAAQNDDQSARGRFTVARVLGPDELGRFSLAANQVVPYNAFVNGTWLADQTELSGKANLLLAAEDETAALAEAWTPEDFGLRFRAEGGAVQLESDGVYLEPEAARAALSIPGAQESLTYLVNSIAKGDAATPYSFVLAERNDALGDDEIIINRWLADELDAKVGDAVEMKYFELMTGSFYVERARAFRVREVVEMEALALDRALAPRFPGLTDVDRCSDWDVGIPMEEEQLENAANEDYWNRYKQTPKAIVSLKAGREMWSNRFGSLTGVRWFSRPAAAADFRERYDPRAAGFVFQPVREQALAAVDGAMDFGQLFIGMSFFLIVAALMLTGLLFVFGVQRRAEEMGVLLATGWRPATARNMLLLEGGAVALAGSTLGALVGVGYTRVLIFGLANYWTGAVANSAIELFVDPGTVVTGMIASFVCALASMAIAVWRQTKHPARELLMADFSQEFQSMEQGAANRRDRGRYVALGLAVAAFGVAGWALTADVKSVTTPFFGAGSLLLIAGVMFCGSLARRGRRAKPMTNLRALASRNATRRVGRSLTVIGLLATGCFLVFAVSAMKEDIGAHAAERWSGTGGFEWYGESTLPIREEIGAVRLRARDGDDASCLNLNRARTPRLLGVDPNAMSARKAFVADDDVWRLLSLEPPDGAVPALVGDTDTAMWGLEAAVGPEKGDVLDYVDAAGRPFKVKLVGRLPMRLSVFQGALLIAEKDFGERFPAEEGYRVFLMNEPVEGRAFERAGLDVVRSVDRMMEFYAVESTYLAMFLALGVMGLAVGSLGMGVVVARNALDRRAELALLRAVGYQTADVRKLLFLEHGALIAAGLGVGLVSAVVAMAPALFISRSRVPIGYLIGLFLFVAAVSVACAGAAVLISSRGDALKGLRSE